MYLTKWDPFESLSALQEDVDRVFNRRLRRADSETASWLPAVDIHETPEDYQFDMEIPGVEKDRLHVKVEDNVLTVHGEKNKTIEDKSKNYHRVEREYGSFSRSFSLPETANADKVQADYKEGVLKIKIAKKEAAQPKKIEVNVS